MLLLSQKRDVGRRGAFMSIDAVVGLAIITILAGALAALLGRHQRAALRLADMREAARVAEAVLTDLQAGRVSPARDREITFQLKPLDAESPAHGREWVELVVKVRKSSAAVTGLVPQGASLPPPSIEKRGSR